MNLPKLHHLGRLVVFITALPLIGFTDLPVQDHSESMNPSSLLDHVRIVRTDMEGVHGTLHFMDESSVVVQERDGDLVTIHPRSIAFIELIAPDSALESVDPKPNSGRLWLVDGTHYSVKPRLSGNQVVWNNAILGRIEPSIERVRAFNRSSDAPPPTSDNGDLVVLGNGDRIEGLVDRIGRDLVIEQLDGSIVEFPFDRVASFSLLNETIPGNGSRLWSTNGDKIPFDDHRYVRGSDFTFSTGSEHACNLTRQVESIVFSNKLLVPLAQLTPEVSGIEGQLRYHNPDPVIEPGSWSLDAPPMLISGPIRLSFELPQPGMGFIAAAILPPTSRRLGSLELVVSDENGVLFEQVIDRDRPTADLRVRIPGRRMILELREHENGPLQDSIRLEQAILIAPTGGS